MKCAFCKLQIKEKQNDNYHAAGYCIGRLNSYYQIPMVYDHGIPSYVEVRTNYDSFCTNNKMRIIKSKLDHIIESINSFNESINDMRNMGA